MVRLRTITKPPRKIEKGWGYEWIWADFPEYCAKILHFHKSGNRMSLHLHRVKHETWWVMFGRFKLEGVDPFSANKISKILEVGDVEVMPVPKLNNALPAAIHAYGMSVIYQMRS